MPASVLIFCASPLVSRPISQRVAVMGAYLAARGWDVQLTAVDPGFQDAPFTRTDPVSGMPIDVIGPTHYREADDGTRKATPPLRHLRECRTMSRRIRERVDVARPDHVVLSTTLPASLHAAVYLRRHHPSVWLDADDWTAGQFLASGGPRLVGRAYELIERTLPRTVRMTVCSTELQKVFPRAALIPNFIRLEEVPARRVPAGSGPAGAKVRVAFAGSVTGFYGHAPLIDALARRRADLGGIEVRIIGDGPGLAACRQQVRAAGLDPIVRFTGQVDRPSLLGELAESDISIVPLCNTKVDRARFPLKLLDGLASGCAVVASDVGTVREVLQDGSTGLLSPAGDADALVKDVLRLSDDRGLLNRLAEAGRDAVAPYDAALVCARWASLLTEAGGA